MSSYNKRHATGRSGYRGREITSLASKAGVPPMPVVPEFIGRSLYQTIINRGSIGGRRVA